VGEDVDWMHLRKPAGVPVLPPHDDPAGDCLLRRLLAVAPEQADALPDDLDDPARWAGACCIASTGGRRASAWPLAAPTRSAGAAPRSRPTGS